MTIIYKAFNFRVLRFLVVGIFNTSFSYGIYAILLYAGLQYNLANLGALIMGILFSFKTQGKYVFRNTNNKLFFRFVISWAVIYLFNICIIGGFIKLGFNAYISGAIALFPVTVFSYIALKTFVYGDKKLSNPSLA
jgi:putative flippase GtrA